MDKSNRGGPPSDRRFPFLSVVAVFSVFILGIGSVFFFGKGLSHESKPLVVEQEPERPVIVEPANGKTTEIEKTETSKAAKLAQDAQQQREKQQLAEQEAQREKLRQLEQAKAAERERAGTPRRSPPPGRGLFPMEPAPSPPPSPPKPDATVEIERYPTIESPSAVSPSDTFSVQVSLTKDRLTPSVRSETAGPLTSIGANGALKTTLPDRNSWKIDVVLSTTDFDLAGGSDSASIILPKDGDSTPALFRLRLRASPQPPRSADLRVTFWFEGRYLARAVRSIGIRNASSTPNPVSSLSSPVVADFQPTSLSPEITVFQTEDERNGKSVCQIIIASRIRAPVKVSCRSSAELAVWLSAQYTKVAAVSHKARALVQPESTAEPIEARALMRGIGEELARMWVPREFWDLFDSLKNRGPRLSIQIFTDHPLLPWELLIPPNSSSDSGFLGTDYDIARWHVNPEPSVVDLPPSRLLLENIDVVAPAYQGAAALPSQQAELTMLQQLRGFHYSGGTFLQVSTLMSNPPQGIVHFAGHGGASAATGVPTYALALEDRLLDLITWRGMSHQTLQHRPLYFLNACDLGQADNFSNFVDGWAPAALDSGASGFIGGIWPLNDNAAALASQGFYSGMKQRLLVGPVRVAELVREIRRQFLQTGDPTYLSYVFYGDVNLSLVLPQGQ
jgi:hypothetical protein